MTSTRSATTLEAVGAWSQNCLSSLDEDEIFLFDEDLPPPPQLKRTKNTSSLTTLVMHDLEYMTLEDGSNNRHKVIRGGADLLLDEDDETLSVSNKTESNFLRKSHFHLYGMSPGTVASSCDSDFSASITIEGLRDHLQSCFTCGVLWRENQASLDCLECDGYALSRPCLECDGSCASVWTRDLTTSHQTHKAKWVGSCKLVLRNCSIGTESCESIHST